VAALRRAARLEGTLLGRGSQQGGRTARHTAGPLPRGTQQGGGQLGRSQQVVVHSREQRPEGTQAMRKAGTPAAPRMAVLRGAGGFEVLVRVPAVVRGSPVESPAALVGMAGRGSLVGLSTGRSNLEVWAVPEASKKGGTAATLPAEEAPSFPVGRGRCAGRADLDSPHAVVVGGPAVLSRRVVPSVLSSSHVVVLGGPSRPVVPVVLSRPEVQVELTRRGTPVCMLGPSRQVAAGRMEPRVQH
jgi:hypothetical protein